ncbi:MAG TPA: GGDEF domain-containing protein [Arenimonas sp.]|uniref:GGDEF domain-containing protein n=1 Tax=Arenimonas sp. TaxID=1872635 RepID=UPI002D7EB36A|nr:GGDEF domain-containing protein [Arenimonas sp.]HEU0153536.1 GGDEF domain-containing protein [Arenimonas sp.]
MSTLRETIEDLAASLREPPDEILLEVGAGGELLVAHLRVGVACLLLLLPLVNHWAGGTPHESLAGLAGALLVLGLSMLWLRLARRPRRVRGLAIATAASDITMVTLVLALLALESPVAAVNSAVVWGCYPLAIFATALRHDVRVTFFAGALALLQTALLWAAVAWLAQAPLVSAVYGTVSTSTQVQRLVLLVAVTLVTAMVVFRAQRLTQFSATDGLTGLPNRNYLNTRVPQLVRDARAQGHTVSLALVDLDNFRHINAELGHLAGDRALRHAVKVLRRELAREEPMIRVGGEEFVLLLRLPIGAAWERMEVLRRRLEATPFVPEAGFEPRRLTLSAGLASCPQDANDLSGLMKRADLRLQAAKQGGRNRVAARDEG